MTRRRFKLESIRPGEERSGKPDPNVLHFGSIFFFFLLLSTFYRLLLIFLIFPFDLTLRKINELIISRQIYEKVNQNEQYQTIIVFFSSLNFQINTSFSLIDLNRNCSFRRKESSYGMGNGAASGSAPRRSRCQQAASASYGGVSSHAGRNRCRSRLSHHG